MGKEKEMTDDTKGGGPVKVVRNDGAWWNEFPTGFQMLAFSEMEAMNRSDAINRALFHLVQKAGLADSLADALRYFIEWGQDLNAIVGHDSTPESWEKFRAVLAAYDSLKEAK